MKQLKLFSEPCIEYVCPSKEEYAELEELALEATKRKLLFGEPSKQTPEARLEVIAKHLGKKRHYGYFIRFEESFIGYVSIDDGFIPFEASYTRPEVELAFVDDNYSQYDSLITVEIYRLLEQIDKSGFFKNLRRLAKSRI